MNLVFLDIEEEIVILCAKMPFSVICGIQNGGAVENSTNFLHTFFDSQ